MMPGSDFSRPSEDRIPELLDALFAGRDGAEEAVVAVLQGPVAASVADFLGRDNTDTDDVIQESLVAVLQYLRRRGAFEGSLVRFAVTIARNRCRNILAWRKRRPHAAIEPMAEWIADEKRSVLDVFGDDQVLAVMRDVLGRIDQTCRNLLRALFLQNRPAEDMKGELGLTTVRAVYYRREACLERMQDAMRRRLGDQAG